MVHLILAAIFGAVFALILLAGPALTSTYAVLLASATVYGFLLWIVNFQIVGALLFPWFTQVNQLVFGFIAHTFFFGTVLGVYLAQAPT